MPISVRLQDENGKAVCQEDVLIGFSVPTGDSGFTLLRYIDPYGDTVFNSLQMNEFISDWERLKEHLKNPEHEVAWKQIEDFARRCLSEPHLYLRFVGD